jgi:HK97 family phage major capsid protein
MNPTLTRLHGEAQAAAKSARAVAEKAAGENRSMTTQEKADYDGYMATGRNKLAELKVAKADEAVLAEAKALADDIGPAIEDATAGSSGGSGLIVPGGGKSLGQQVFSSAQFKAAIAPYGGGRVPEKSRFQTDPIPVKSLVKALIVGASDTSGGAFVVADQSGIVEMLGRREVKIRDLISLRRTTSDTVEFVRQTSHTNNAAPVAEATSSAAPTAPGGAGALVNVAGGGYKPEGAWAFERDTAVVKTIAEWVPATKRSLSDVASLEGLINDELRADVAEEEEDQIVSGDGTGENLEGILTVSGTQAQVFSGDIFETVRKALTKVRITGRSIPNGIGFNPADAEAVELLRDNENRFFGNGPFGMGPQTLWGVPYFIAEGIPAGNAIVADWRKAVLWDREQTTITMTDSHADFFVRNLVAILGEERVAFAVTRPTAFCITDVVA